MTVHNYLCSYMLTILTISFLATAMAAIGCGVPSPGKVYKTFVQTSDNRSIYYMYIAITLLVCLLHDQLFQKWAYRL